MYKVVKKSEGTLRQISERYQALNLITKDITPNVSLVVAEAKEFKDITTTKYDRIYYILKGTLTLIINNNEIQLNEGDSCYLSAGTKYIMKGTFKSVIVNQPAFGTEIV